MHVCKNMHLKCLILALVGFNMCTDLFGQGSCICIECEIKIWYLRLPLSCLQAILLATLEPVSEVFDVVDQDELLLGASVHKVPEDNVATRIHPHMSKGVLRETRLNQAGRQLSLLLQH